MKIYNVTFANATIEDIFKGIESLIPKDEFISWIERNYAVSKSIVTFEDEQIDTEADELIDMINLAYPIEEGCAYTSEHISEILKNIVNFVRRNHV